MFAFSDIVLLIRFVISGGFFSFLSRILNIYIQNIVESKVIGKYGSAMLHSKKAISRPKSPCLIGL